MAGAAIQVTATGFERVDALIARLANPDFDPLLDAIGALVVSQTEERIAQDKAAPDGEAWPELSERYAKRKKKGGGILELEGDLRDSLTHLVSGQTIEVGSNLIYAATHQFGDEDRGIPQREFLGLSDENTEAINELIDDWFEQLSAAQTGSLK